MPQPRLPYQTPLQGVRAPQTFPPTSQRVKGGDGKEPAAKKGGTIGKDGDGFPEPEECIMIFGGSDAIWTKRQHKVRYREACATEMAVPSFLS